MTTYNYIETTTHQHYGAGLPVTGQDKFFVLSRTFDAAQAKTDMSVTAWVAEDVVKLIDIPAKTLVVGVAVEVTTAEATVSAHLDIGDSDDDINGWEDAIDVTVATIASHIYSKTHAGGGSVADRENGYYKAANTIDAVLGAAVWTNCVFTLKVICVDLS